MLALFRYLYRGKRLKIEVENKLGGKASVLQVTKATFLSSGISGYPGWAEPPTI
jgi:hypothetical protein